MEKGQRISCPSCFPGKEALSRVIIFFTFLFFSYMQKNDIKNQSEGFIMLFKPVIALVFPVRSTWE